MSTFLPQSVVRRNRALSHLMDLCRRVIEDGEVSKHEAEAFRYWVEAHPDMTGVAPANHLVPMLRVIFEDGVATEEERTRLFKLIETLIGEDVA